MFTCYILNKLGKLASENEYFSTAEAYTVPMFILSLFSIYVRPSQKTGIIFDFHGLIRFLIFIISLILTLLLAYNLFMGISELARKRNKPAVSKEAQLEYYTFEFLP